jgi:hypothetical protein
MTPQHRGFSPGFASNSSKRRASELHRGTRTPVIQARFNSWWENTPIIGERAAKFR